jgi:(hydroxyamino)benzene mutase
MATEATETPHSPVARFLGLAGAILLLLGFLTGGYVSAAMTGKISADVHSALASHLNAVLGAFWIFGVAWSLPLLQYGPIGQKRLAWSVIVPNYANWIVTAIKALLNVAGVDFSGSPANMAIFLALTFTVVLPSLGSTIAWINGFRRP